MSGKAFLNKSYYLLASILILILVSPYLALLSNVNEFDLSVFNKEFFNVLYQSLKQALLSSVLIVFLGLMICLSFFNKNRKLIVVICVLPLFLPVLLVVLSLVQMINLVPGFKFPYGLYGVVLSHVYIYTGFAAYSFYQSICSRVGKLSEVALVHAVPQWKFITKIVVPLIKGDMAIIFLFSFMACFLSFSVPLLVGGADGNTLEILIYEKLRVSEQFNEVFSLSIFQSLFIFILYGFVKKFKPMQVDRNINYKVINFKLGLFYPLLIFASLSWMLGAGLLKGFEQFTKVYSASEALSLFAGSLIIGLGVGLLSYAALYLICGLYKYSKFQNFILRYLVPSGAITGFSFLVIFKYLNVGVELKIILALFILQLAVIYKLFIYQNLKSLSKQIETAVVFGTDSIDLHHKIIHPQMKPHMAWASCVAAFWAIGDFSLSKIIANSDFNLALTMKTLMSNYRFESANFLALLLILAGVVIYLIFWRQIHVRD